MNIYPFTLEFKNDSRGMPFFASFPFIVDGITQVGISCGISSLFAGDMKYEATNQNRRGLFCHLGLDPANVFGLGQVHSRDVLIVDRRNPPNVQADGLLSQDRGISLSVTVADCLPVFLYDTKTRVFALVHSGWKGTGIALVAINLMQKNWGTAAGDVAAILGPCIGQCCYRVDAGRAGVFEREFGEESVRKSGGEFFLDLKGANVKLLADAGVRNISVCTDCTFTDKRLGSFRRQGLGYTRMVTLVYNE